MFDQINAITLPDSMTESYTIIPDKDNRYEERHAKLKKYLSDRYCCLECLEIENLIAPPVLKKVISEYEINDEIAEFNKNRDHRRAYPPAVVYYVLFSLIFFTFFILSRTHSTASSIIAVKYRISVFSSMS
jgi:hypothetical protein